MFLGLVVPTTPTVIYMAADRLWRLRAESISGCKLGAKCTQIALDLTDFRSVKSSRKSLGMLAGAKGLESAASYVTGLRSAVNSKWM